MSENDLAQYLDALEREDSFRVDAVLKQSATETTQRVFLKGPSGQESGPYIRKFIQRETGLGGAYERIYQACRQGARFDHIPHVSECYFRDEALVVVMEHVNGPTLQDVVYEANPSVQLAASLFPRICDAVGELHTRFDPPIIHRDLKPSNIVMRNGVPVIIDFGIAREFKDGSDTDTKHFGTRAYAPPEQFGYGQTTVQSDVYALGMLLYYLLVERTPTPQAAQAGFADAAIPEPLRQVVACAAAFDPANRYASVFELKAAFGRALVQAGPPGICPAAYSAPVPGQPAPPSTAMAPFAAPSPPSPAPKAFTVRNAVVFAFYAIFVLASIWLGIDPNNGSNGAARYPFAYNAYAYLAYMPVLFTVIAYFLMDRRWLRQRVPFFQAIAGWKAGGRPPGGRFGQPRRRRQAHAMRQALDAGLAWYDECPGGHEETSAATRCCEEPWPTRPT